MCLRPSSSFKTFICLPFLMSSATQSFTLLNRLLNITLTQSHVTNVPTYFLKKYRSAFDCGSIWPYMLKGRKALIMTFHVWK